MLISTLKKLIALCDDNDELYVRSIDDNTLLDINAVLVEVENEREDRRDLIISVNP